MCVNDIRPLPRKPLSETWYVGECAEALFSDGPVQVLRTAGSQAFAQGPVCCNNRYTVPLCRRVLGQLDRNQLRSTQVQ